MKQTKNCWKLLKIETINKYLIEGEKVTPVLGYEDYFITSLGRVFSAKKTFTHETLDKEMYGCIVWKELKPFYTHRYKTVTLIGNGKRKNIPIHKLVYEGFFGHYDTKFFKIVYKDKDPENCRASNLRLEFKNKSQKTLEKYQRQRRLYEALEIC